MNAPAHSLSLPVARSTPAANAAIASRPVRSLHIDGTLVGIVLGMGMWLVLAAVVLSSLVGLGSMQTPSRRGDAPVQVASLSRG